MKLIQEIDQSHFKKLAPFQFTDQIKNSLPVLRDRIQQFVLRDVKNWLTTYINLSCPFVA